MTTETTKRLLIGNLPDTAQTSAVESIFKAVGRVVSINLIRNGFAFVEMTSADADRARRELNGYRYEGRPMMIDEAHPRHLTRS
jgi:RNA recognition motif-containing protein